MNSVQLHTHSDRKGTAPDCKIPDRVLDSWQELIETMEELSGLPITVSINDEYKNKFCSCANGLNDKGLLKFSSCGTEKRNGHSAADNHESSASCLGYPVLWPHGEIIGNIKIHFHEHCTDFNDRKNEKRILKTIKKSMEADLELVYKNAMLNAINNEMRGSILEKLNLDMLPVICSYCKKIKNREDYWNRIDQFFHSNYKISFTHGICPECSEELMKEINY